MPMTLEEAKLFYPPNQILSDGIDVVVCTMDGSDYVTYTLISRDAYDNKRRFLKVSPLEQIKGFLEVWLKEYFNLDLETFHPCQ